MGVWQRLWGAVRGRPGVAAGQAEPQALVSADQAGTTPIAQVTNRQHCRVNGLIRSVVVGSPGQGHGFEIDLHDGTGALKAVWLGQRDIPGLAAGRRVTVEGLITVGPGGQRTVMNPRYHLTPLERTS